MGFKIGDTVRLKSGGPLMTVTGVNQRPNVGEVVWCAWFDEKNNEKTGFYPATAVVPHDGSINIA
jgi:uncharacterized protein YodC (DUF2158 family)